MKSNKVKRKRKSHLPPGYKPRRSKATTPLLQWCETVAARRKAQGIDTNAAYLSKVAGGSTPSAALFRSLWDEPDCPHELLKDKFGALK